MEQLYLALTQWVQAYGLHGAFLFMVAESAGAPLPTQIAFICAQGQVITSATTHEIAFFWLVAGQLVGSGAAFYLGRATDSALARRLARKPSVMQMRAKLHGWYARHGALTILFGRLVGHVRPWASFIAGLSQVPPLVFWLWTVVGTLIFTAGLMWITVFGWRFWLAHPELRTPIIVGMLVLFYGLPLCKIIQHMVQGYRRRRQHLTSE